MNEQTTQATETRSTPKTGKVVAMGKPSGRKLFCPFPSAVHPSVERINERSIQWARQMGLARTDKHVQKLGASKIGWLVSRAFPTGNEQALQLASDWTVVFCLLDDALETMKTSVEVDAYLGLVLNVFKGTQATPAEPDAVLRAMLDLRARMLELASGHWVDRFIEQLGVLFICFGLEAVNRELGISPDVVSYLQMREVTVGLYVEFLFFDLIAGIQLPVEVREHPAMRRLASKASNIVGWANDICTYEKEMQQGELHNLVLVLMKSESLSLAEAVEKAVYIHDSEVSAFKFMQRQVPSFGPQVDAQVKQFIAMLSSWVRGHLDWAHETGRYLPTAEGASTEAA
jgi:5-epi-alpha-selinene synthase